MSTNSSAPGPDMFAFELLKLLLQLAWADDDVAPEEQAALLAYARKHALTSEQVELLEACLAGKAPLPPPNLGFLKERRLDVLRAARELLTSDQTITEEEEAVLAQISALLK